MSGDAASVDGQPARGLPFALALAAGAIAAAALALVLERGLLAARAGAGGRRHAADVDLGDQLLADPRVAELYLGRAATARR